LRNRAPASMPNNKSKAMLVNISISPSLRHIWGRLSRTPGRPGAGSRAHAGSKKADTSVVIQKASA
jgi:hypothetical protein